MPRSLQLRIRAPNREGEAQGSERPIGLDAANAERGPRAATEPGESAVALVQDWFGNLEVQNALTSPSAGIDGPIADALLFEEAGIAGVAHEGLRSNATMLSGWRGQREPGLDLEDPAVRRLGPVGGQPMPEPVRERMEQAFGHDFEHVRIHTDSQAVRAAEALNARAFALGSHLFFGPGAWAPGTPEGDRVLAHELTHVEQHDDGALSDQHGVSEATDRYEVEAYGNEDRILDALSHAPIGEEAPETPAAAPLALEPAEAIQRTEAEDREADRDREALEAELEDAREDRERLRRLLDGLGEEPEEEGGGAVVDFRDFGLKRLQQRTFEDLRERARTYLEQLDEKEKPDEEKSGEEAEEAEEAQRPGLGQPEEPFEDEADQVTDRAEDAAPEEETPAEATGETEQPEKTRRLATGRWEAGDGSLSLDLQQDGARLEGRFHRGEESSGTLHGMLDHDDEQETVFTFAAQPESGGGPAFAGTLRLVESGALSLVGGDGSEVALTCAG